MILKFFILFASGWSALAVDSQNPFKQVIERRAEMEVLSREVRSLQESYAQRNQQSEAQILEVESQIHQLKLKKAQLAEKKKFLTASLESHTPESKDSRQIVNKWLGVLNKSIQNSLPFELIERKKKVQDLENRWQGGEPTISVLWSLWTISNEELGLTRGIHYSLLKDSSSQQEKEVVRLGMWRMYERNLGDYTLIENKNQEWVRIPLKKADDKSAAKKLFEASQKKSFEKILNLPQGETL